MTFTYTYRSSDGQRHTAEIEAESRDAAFARVRAELGIKPIKVVAAAGHATAQRHGGYRPIVPYVLLVVFVLSAVGVALWWMRRDGGIAPYRFTVNTPQGPVTYTAAAPLPRQAIPGDRARIEAARETAFKSPAERLLARFAEPGRMVENGFSSPAHEDFKACLREPIRIASTDFTEVVDLKRIVTGMKREMNAYLTGGGTVQQYLAELAKRQKLEISYRERAEQRLDAMLRKHDSSPGQASKQSNNNALRDAYAYWLKVNASLKSMGIYELPLPDALYGYQSGLDLE